MESSWLPLIFAVVLPNTVSSLEAVFMRGSLKTWYPKLKKAPWTPPNWVFGPVWTTLYSSMGYASYLVWSEGQQSSSAEVQEQVRCALWMYGIQLILNWLWTPLFFNLHLIGLSLIEFAVLWVAVVLTVYDFYLVNHVAAYLLLPYLAWGTYAITLNYYIWTHNPSGADRKKK